MKRDLVIANVESIISSFNDWERQAYEKICNKLKNVAKNEIQGRYELAKVVAEIADDMKKNKTYYRSSFLKDISLCLGFKSDMPLREMIKVAKRWGSWEELEQEVLSKLPTNLRWKDIVFLSKAKDEEEYNHILENIQSSKPTAVIAQSMQQQDELEVEVSSQKGRKPKLPESYDDLLMDVSKTCRQIVRKVQQAWMTFDMHESITGILEDNKNIDENWKKLKNAYLKVERAIQSLKEFKIRLRDEAVLFHAHVNDELPNEFDDDDYEIVDVANNEDDYEDPDLPTE